jgi:hypothetical protein
MTTENVLDVQTELEETMLELERAEQEWYYQELYNFFKELESEDK